MGWCAGEEILCEAWEKVREYIPEEERVEILAELIDVFENHDMDCYEGLYEFSEGEAALQEIHPDWEHK